MMEERAVVDGAQPVVVEHTLASVRRAAEEFIELLGTWDEPDPSGYYEELPASRYFFSLIEDEAGAYDALVRNLMFGLDRFPPGRVLDIGCGHGLQSFVFARHGHEVIGLDMAEHRTMISNRIAKAADLPGLTYVTGNAREEVGRLRGSALWMHRSFHHIPVRRDFDASALQYFRQVHTSLEPGGVLVFTTSNASSRSLLPWVSPGQHKAKHLVELMEQADFDVTDVEYRGYLSALPARIRPRSSTKIDETLARVPGVRRLGGSLTFAAKRR